MGLFSAFLVLATSLVGLGCVYFLQATRLMGLQTLLGPALRRQSFLTSARVYSMVVAVPAGDGDPAPPEVRLICTSQRRVFQGSRWAAARAAW